MEANKPDGCPSNSFLILFICLQCSDNDLGRRSRDVLYEPGGKVDLISAVFSRYLSCIRSAIKIVLSAKTV